VYLLSGQTSSYSLEYEVPDTSISFFSLDKLEQLYVVTSTNEVVKYDAKGREQFRFNNNLLGDMGHFDMFNPMSLLCYYPDYLQFIVLDRTLSEVVQVEMSRWGYWNIAALGLASDNRFWVFDGVNLQLKKVDRQGQEVVASPSLIQLTGSTFQPVFLIERGQQVFLTDPQRGVLVFDVFGQLIQKISLLGIERFQVLGRQLIYFRDQNWIAYHLDTFEEVQLTLPATATNQAQVTWQIGGVAVRTKTGIAVYSYQRS
jgi:hypothetical protein